MKFSLSHDCAEFVCSLGYEGLPEPVVAGGRRPIIDTVACMLAGAREPVAEKILRFALKERVPQGVTVIGTDCRLPAGSAGLVTATMAHAVDYDDVLTSTRSHPSAVLVPTVLAVGQELKKSGRDVIVAYLAGLEIIDKLGSLTAFAQYARGWHTTGTIGVLGAAAAAAKLMDLPPEQVRTALGIAASTAGGLRRNFGTMTKPLHCGLTVQSGIMAAMLAADGFTAADDVFPGEDGYWATLADSVALSETPPFGAPFAVISPGLYLKRYPCCFATHRAIDAVLNIRRRHAPVDPARVRTVTCRAPKGSFLALIHEFAHTGLEGKFCMQYAVAAGLLDGRVTLRSFTDDMVQRPEMQALMNKITKVEDPDLPVVDAEGVDRRFTEVKVEMADGEIFAERVDRPKGSVDVPLSDEEIGEKFLDCSTGVLPGKRAHAALSMLAGLENLEDLSGLMDNLSSAR